MRRISSLLIVVMTALCSPAAAQTLRSLTIGELLIPALKRMPQTQNFNQVGNYVAIKWLYPSATFSATASPDTGKIVFLEEDLGDGAAARDNLLPGLVLGATTLNDIRQRFGSNGFGFTSNLETVHDGSLTGINCYELRAVPGVFVAFVTRLLSSVDATQRPSGHPNTGDGVLVALIVANKTYLQEIWGTQVLVDPGYKPIDINGLVSVN